MGRRPAQCMQRSRDNIMPDAPLKSARAGAGLRMLSCLTLAGLLAGCVPIGIRGTTLPIYGGAQQNPDTGAPAGPGIV
jgi:hypothetical protein